MEILSSIEVRATRIPDAVDKLRYLRLVAHRRKTRQLSAKCGLGVVFTGVAFIASGSYTKPNHLAESIVAPHSGRAFPAALPLKPWIVENRDNYSVYSNGLQIRNDYVTASVPRRFHTFSRRTFTRSEVRTVPAGIVFHTTESLLLPMEEARNGSLVRTREDLLLHVRGGHLYNLVIDRFGQVFRVVPEDQVAHHAGFSVWADDDTVYEGLNESFIGVSFEARSGGAFEPSAAQTRSARLLTDMLRSTYGIPDFNCVTHAQVSVNPDNMRFGYHTDWASKFPFQELGLTSGYDAPIAAVAVFGFNYDSYFLQAIGGRPWEGLLLAEEHLDQEAQRLSLTPDSYREHLQQQYRRLRSHHENAAASNRTTYRESL